MDERNSEEVFVCARVCVGGARGAKTDTLTGKTESKIFRLKG